jgi:hypothetical protein
MPSGKKTLNQATIEDFKIHPLPGISKPRYKIFLYIPNGWLDKATEGLGISANFVNQQQLRDMVLYAGSVSVEKVNKTNLLVSFEISEPYLSAVQTAAQQVPDDAELRLSATKSKE